MLVKLEGKGKEDSGEVKGRGRAGDYGKGGTGGWDRSGEDRVKKTGVEKTGGEKKRNWWDRTTHSTPFPPSFLQKREKERKMFLAMDGVPVVHLLLILLMVSSHCCWSLQGLTLHPVFLFFAWDTFCEYQTRK